MKTSLQNINHHILYKDTKANKHTVMEYEAVW